MRVSREGGVQGESFHAAIPATRSRHLTDVILITCACFERELPIKVAIIGLCEHDTATNSVLVRARPTTRRI